jgi:hypothetical protein
MLGIERKMTCSEDESGYDGWQLALPGFEAALGKVWRLRDGVWHAELFGGWWVSVAASRKSAVDSVLRMFENESGKLDR